MAEELGKILGEILQSGLFPDLPGKVAPVFVDGKNVLFSDGSVQPIPGQYVLTAGSNGTPIRGLLSTRSGSTPVLYFGDDSKLYRYTISGGTAEVGSGYNSAGNAWSLGRWGTWVLATNNVDTPQIYKGSSFGALGGISGNFTRARFFLIYRNYALAFNTDQNDSAIFWCHADDPELWTAATNNSARSLNIRDTTSGITSGLVFDQQIFYWTRRSMSVMNFLGSPLYFSSALVSTEVGSFGPQATTQANNMLWGIGPAGVWVSNGRDYTYIDEGAVHDFIFQNINLAQAHKCVALHDSYTKHVIFWIPGEGESEVSYGVAYNYAQKGWTIRGDARSAAINTGDFDWAILGDTSGNIYAQSLVGAPVSAQDPNLYVEGASTFSVPLFGQSGFGQGGFGGSFAGVE